jgi:DNA-binding transcriptional ArsR family regulator
VALVFAALADVNRLRIVELLVGVAELSGSELTALIRKQRPSLSQPLLAWHLRVLRKRDLLHMRREGRQTFYRLNRARWREVVDTLDMVANTPRVTDFATRFGEELGVRPL